MTYKWRSNLTLKRKFVRKGTTYTCAHSDSGDMPCQHPSHYEGVSLYFTASEINDLDLAVGLYIEESNYAPEMEDLRRRLSGAVESLEYPYEEGYES